MAPVPSIGRIVHAVVDPAENNGADIAPAVIVRVWPSPDPDAAPNAGYVNARVLLDGHDTPWITSVHLYESEETARAAVAEHPQLAGRVLFWPPRTGGPILAQSPPEPEPVDPRARLVELAVTIESAAKGSQSNRPGDAAALYGVVASIWQFLATHPPQPDVTVVHRHQCAPLNDNQLRNFLARERARNRITL